MIVAGPDEPDRANGRGGGFCAPVAERERGGGRPALAAGALSPDADGITLPAPGVAAIGTDPLAAATGIDVLRGPAGTAPPAALGADVITLPALGVAAIGAAGIEVLVAPAVAVPGVSARIEVLRDPAGTEALVAPAVAVPGVSARIEVLRDPTGTVPLALVTPEADVITLPVVGVAAIATGPPFVAAAGIDVLRDPDDVAGLGVAAGIDVLRDPAGADPLGVAAGIEVLRDPAGADALVAPDAEPVADLIPAELSLAPVGDVVALVAAAGIDVLRDPAGADPLLAALGVAAAIEVLRTPAGAEPLVASDADLIPAEFSLVRFAPDADLIPAEFSLAPVAAAVVVAPDIDVLRDPAGAGALGVAAAIDVLREPAGAEELVAPGVPGFGALADVPAADGALDVAALGAGFLAGGAAAAAGTVIAGLEAGALDDDAAGLAGLGSPPLFDALEVPGFVATGASLFDGIVTFAVPPVVDAFATVAATVRDVVREGVGAASGLGVGSATDCLTSLARSSSWATGVCWSCSHSCSSIASISTTELDVSLSAGGVLVIALPRRRDRRRPRTLPSRLQRCAARIVARGCRRRRG